MRQPWYTFFAVLALTLVLAAGVAFAGNGKITGTVIGPDGAPLAGANVILVGTMQGASADVEGRFIVLNVPPGTYRVRAAAVGYAAQVITGVRVGSDQAAEDITASAFADALEGLRRTPG